MWNASIKYSSDVLLNNVRMMNYNVTRERERMEKRAAMMGGVCVQSLNTSSENR